MPDHDRSAKSARCFTGTQLRRARLIRLGAVGLAGAVTVTLLNEGVRRVLPRAPRTEVIGERVRAGSLDAVGVTLPHGAPLYRWTLLGDLLSNTLYSGLVGRGARQGAWERGGLLGLGRQPGARSPTPPTLAVG